MMTVWVLVSLDLAAAAVALQGMQDLPLQLLLPLPQLPSLQPRVRLLLWRLLQTLLATVPRSHQSVMCHASSQVLRVGGIVLSARAGLGGTLVGGAQAATAPQQQLLVLLLHRLSTRQQQLQLPWSPQQAPPCH